MTHETRTKLADEMAAVYLRQTLPDERYMVFIVDVSDGGTLYRGNLSDRDQVGVLARMVELKGGAVSLAEDTDLRRELDDRRREICEFLGSGDCGPHGNPWDVADGRGWSHLYPEESRR